jgi:hypothetical protein
MKKHNSRAQRKQVAEQAPASTTQEHKMEARMIAVTHQKAPTDGTALYFVVGQGHQSVTLLHPVTFSQFTVPKTDYITGVAKRPDGTQISIWPENNSDLKFHPEEVAVRIENRMRSFASQGKAFPQQIIRRLVAEMKGIPLNNVPTFKEPPAEGAPRGFAVRSEKRPGVVSVVQEMIERENGASFDEIFNELNKRFPGRGAGMKTTIRCQLDRIPQKLNQKLVFIRTRNAAIVYRMVDEMSNRSSARNVELRQEAEEECHRSIGGTSSVCWALRLLVRRWRRLYPSIGYGLFLLTSCYPTS